jgi:hypothetical protein
MNLEVAIWASRRTGKVSYIIVSRKCDTCEHVALNVTTHVCMYSA